jgi:hypothetical protein
MSDHARTLIFPWKNFPDDRGYKDATKVLLNGVARFRKPK